MLDDVINYDLIKKHKIKYIEPSISTFLTIILKI